MFVIIKLKDAAKKAEVLVLVVLMVAVVIYALPSGNMTAAFGPYGSHTLVIDPGHGGIDGGAVSADGHKESDINLAIALKMSALCDFLGIDSVLTRSSDSDNSADGSYSEHDSLVTRAQIANSAQNAVLISVHQNKFPSEAVSGAEVMYAPIQGSRRLAEIAQESMVNMLDPENRRVARPAPKELLLTASVECPAILAECGFMSNPDEVKRLISDEYQLKIAAALVGSYIQFSCETENIQG